MIEGLSVGSVNLAAYESPHPDPAKDPLPAIVAMIEAAKKTIYFSGYSFTQTAISAALIAAFNRGVTIYCVADASQYGAINSQWPVLIAAGITNIKVWGSQYDLAHEKVIVVDGDTVNKNCRVEWGSYNYTTSAEKTNKEVATIASGIQASRQLGPMWISQIQSVYALGKDPAVAAATTARKPVSMSLVKVPTPPPEVMQTAPTSQFTNPAFILSALTEVSAILTLFFHKDWGISANQSALVFLVTGLVSLGAYISRAVKTHSHGNVLAAWFSYMETLIENGQATTDYSAADPESIDPPSQPPSDEAVEPVKPTPPDPGMPRLENVRTGTVSKARATPAKSAAKNTASRGRSKQ